MTLLNAYVVLMQERKNRLCSNKKKKKKKKERSENGISVACLLVVNLEFQDYSVKQEQQMKEGCTLFFLAKLLCI